MKRFAVLSMFVGLEIGCLVAVADNARGDDGSGDPSFTLSADTVNNSGFAWSGYDLDLSMSTSFTFSGVVPNVPADWSVVVQNPGGRWGAFSPAICSSARERLWTWATNLNTRTR